MKYVIKWRNRLTGVEGQETKTFTLAEAEKIAIKLNETTKDTSHWPSPVEEKEMETLEEKMRYVASYRRDKREAFIQYWPDENGNFNLATYVNEICDNLEDGNDPVVPAGATEMRLSALMRIKTEQWRPLSDDEEIALERLKHILKK